MKAFIRSSWLVLLALVVLTPRPACADSVYANGFLNTSLGGADLEATVPTASQYGYYPDHPELNVAGIDIWGLDGATVHLGKARGGAYFYAWAYVDTGRSMSALSFGSVNGKTGRYLAAIYGERGNDYNQFTAWVDFSPLCIAPYRYRFYSGGRLIREVTTWERNLRIYSYYAPRVNPCALQTNGVVAAIIDFQWSGASVGLGDTESEYADLIIIEPTGQTNRVDYVSSVQVRGGGGLQDFFLYQVRPVVFEHPHRIIGGGSRFTVNPDSLKVSLDPTHPDPHHAVWIEFKPAGQVEAQLKPVALSNVLSGLTVEGIGFGTWGGGTYMGRASLIRQFDGLEFAGQLMICSNMQAVVYRDGLPVGASAMLTNTVTLLGQGDPLVLAAGALSHTLDHRAALYFRLDRLTAFTTPEGETLEGDEVRVQAGIGASLAYVEALGVGATNLASFTITNEISTPVVTPELSIMRMTNSVVLSWPDPNRQYYVECSIENPDGYWSRVQAMPMFMSPIASLMLSLSEAEDRFYRLALGISWDMPMIGGGRD